MTQSENSYQQDVFLEDLRYLENRHKQRIWVEHQEMQLCYSKATASILLQLCLILVVALCVWGLF